MTKDSRTYAINYLIKEVRSVPHPNNLIFLFFLVKRDGFKFSIIRQIRARIKVRTISAIFVFRKDNPSISSKEESSNFYIANLTYSELLSFTVITICVPVPDVHFSPAIRHLITFTIKYNVMTKKVKNYNYQMELFAQKSSYLH